MAPAAFLDGRGRRHAVQIGDGGIALRWDAGELPLVQVFGRAITHQALRLAGNHTRRVDRFGGQLYLPCWLGSYIAYT